ncbi:hypothetical protein HYC85_022652 [Camellia sinensis]|uniref:anthranilate synthase n=1 Tax=Camellia sinensis TaxID=4442 RepID=A0A7J7GC88_CAMSI|nr:hypothetical protein HYC85_022652 [Camellia sinensis]
METMRATGLVCQSSLVEFKRSSLPRKTLTPHPPTGSRVSLPFRNHGSLLLLRMAEPSKIPMAVSQNASVASQLVSVKNKITNPIVVIDNYDSFTYNLCQYMGELGCNFEVYRNDELTVDELKKKNPRGVLISPGPGTPQDSGISLQTVLELGPTVPLFGVCMGLQCIGEAFGECRERVRGSGLISCDKDLLAGSVDPFTAGRYHSLVIEKESFPHEVLEMTAWTEDGLGVQFHPESIITSEGKMIVKNFIKLIEKKEEAESQE